jgi:UDP-N-acetylmuramate dehydrogenase
MCGPAVPLGRLLDWAEEQGLAGLEFLEGIPGTVGGAVRMNAGAWGSEIGSRVAGIRCWNADGTERRIARSDLGLGYRRCAALRGRVLFEAELALEPGEPGSIRERRSEFAARRAWFRGLRCAGSVFRNPPGDYAGRLVEAAGLKGRRLGGARISEQHANVIVAESGAQASDVRALVEMARRAVAAKFGVTLESEIVLLGSGAES